LDVSSFCCQAYLEGLVLTITRAWNKQHGVPGATVVGFTILRDGSVEGVAVRRTSGFAVLDSAAMRAVSQRFAPLPSEYPNATLSLRITFEYEG
jgi:TonB family protein